MRPLSLISRRQTQTQTEELQPSQAPKECFFPVYNLPWSKLLAYLEETFPELIGSFEEKVGIAPI
jgi:hypothetical protein